MDRLSVPSLCLVVLAAAVSCLAGLGCASSMNGNGAEAGNAPNASAQKQPASQSGRVTDAQLDEFARISQQIHQIRMQSEQRLEGAETEQESRQIRQQALQQIRSVFDRSEMTQEEYQAIGRQLKNNPKLRQRLKKRLEDQQDR